MGSLYLKQEDLLNARKFADLAFDNAELSGLILPKKNASNLLYLIFQKQEQYKEALFHFNIVAQLEDSLSGSEIKMETIQRELEYQNEKEKAITEVDKEKKLAITKSENKRKKIIVYGLIGALILVILFLIILYSRLRITTSQKKVIETQENERKLLLKEIHHRVKNNFQIVSSVLKLQASDLNNPIIDEAFEGAINRIHSMSVVHDMIYEQDDFGSIIPQEYLEKLTHATGFYSKGKEVQFQVNSNVASLDIQELIPIGISVNEMIANSIKYAFNEKIEIPTIFIELNQLNGDYILSYKDNGVAFDKALFNDSFGMELIKTIIEQIDGVLTEVSDKEWNTHLKITFK